MSIQVDMFDVQLGAALLLQFRTEDGVVRVLADGGNKKHKVGKRLDKAMTVFNGGEKRIDLIVGTHYDADHLAGLVDVIKDDAIEIGEAWLPPVANDVDATTAEVPPSDDPSLTHQFMGPEGPLVLRRYLRHKAMMCRIAARGFSDRDAAERAFEAADGEDVVAISNPEVFFGEHLAAARAELRPFEGLDRERALSDHVVDGHIHDPDEPIEPHGWRTRPFTFDALAILKDGGKPDWLGLLAAIVRESAAKDALNARWLNQVCVALKDRRIPAFCHTIPDGVPQVFSWDDVAKAFRQTAIPRPRTPNLMLLGPSEGLVAKYQHRLPVGSLRWASRFVAEIVNTTASNELSYVIRFDHQGQHILVAGDAGCVDFAPSPGTPFHPNLITALDRLNVVQVAHHGGANAYFYNCLTASGYRQAAGGSYLLLSHEASSASRPSPAFSNFVKSLGPPAPDVKLLFTAQPSLANVKDVLGRFAPTTPADSNTKGDVRLEFDAGGWMVSRHRVAPPIP